MLIHILDTQPRDFILNTVFSCIESQCAFCVVNRQSPSLEPCIHLYSCNFYGKYYYSTKMAVLKIALAFIALIAFVSAQRPFYAGLRPIGFPESDTPDLLSNRFGEDEDQPILAKGDRNLINRLNQLPVDRRPFWYLNWRQYEDFARQPQTWPQRPNSFIGTR